MASLLKGAAGAAKETTNIVLDLNKEIEKLFSKLAEQPQEVLHVYSWSDQTKTIQEKSCIAFKNADMSTTKLSDIRELLVTEGVLEPTLLWSSFCNQRGAKILDTTTFKSYLGILNEKSSEVGDIAEDNADSYRVYLKSEKIIDYDHIRALSSRGAKVAIDKKVPELPPASQPKAPELPTSFSHNIFLNPTTTFSIVHAADMSETQWSVVIRNNSLLNAYRVVDAGGKIGRIVERSMHTAFSLKPRLFQNYQISASAASDSIAKQKQTLRIPRFRIEDDSYIEQFEKTKSVSRAIAQSSLSQLAAELAVEGGAFGVSASLSASYGEDNSSSSSSSSSDDTRVMSITYNFPRAVIDFDRYSLDLSEECQLDLASVDSVAAIDNFKDKYGRFFPTRIELGGRLHSSEESTASTTAGKADQAKSMRAAAALSFSSPYVQASANMSYAQSSDSSSQNTGASTSKSVCWEAKGGDTLLCNDPPAWAYTVGSFYNWRTVKQSRVLSIEDVISTIPGYQDTKQKFADILRDESQIKPTTSQTTIGFTLTMRNQKKFTAPQGSDSGKFAQTVYDLAKNKVMTEERMAYLNRLIPSIEGAAPVKLLANDNSTNQKFYVNVETTNTNEDKQLKYNYPYRIYNKTNTGDGQSTWLATSSILRGFIDTGIVWAGKLENATTFQLLYPGVGSHSGYVQNGDEVYLQLYDKDGKDYGYGERILNPPDCFGLDWDIKTNPDHWFLKVNYV